MPKVSVIVPVYNSERYLRECLESVAAQSLSDIEIIIVNDGSTDSSRDIIEEFCKSCGRKAVCIDRENGGQAAARNIGMRAACGEYIAFVDSDDSLCPEALELLYDKAEREGLDILCFDYYSVRNGKATREKSSPFGGGPDDIRYILGTTSPWNKIYSRALLSENGIAFAEGRIYEDLELVPALALYTDKIGFLDEALYYYNVRGGSVMRRAKYGKELADIYFVMSSLEKRFCKTKYACALEYLYIEHLLHLAAVRFLGYPEGREDICKISRIMRDRFPRWRKNPYYTERMAPTTRPAG